MLAQSGAWTMYGRHVNLFRGVQESRLLAAHAGRQWPLSQRHPAGVAQHTVSQPPPDCARQTLRIHLWSRGLVLAAVTIELLPADTDCKLAYRREHACKDFELLQGRPAIFPYLVGPVVSRLASERRSIPTEFIGVAHCGKMRALRGR